MTEEDRRCYRLLVLKDRKQHHNQIFGEISRVGTAITNYARSVIQVSSLPEAHFGLLKFTLALLHSLYSSYCHAVPPGSEGDSAKANSFLLCFFFTVNCQKWWEHVNAHHIRTLLFNSPEWGFMLPWELDPLSMKVKIFNALSPARLLNNLLLRSFMGSNDQPFSPVWSSSICKVPWR